MIKNTPAIRTLGLSTLIIALLLTTGAVVVAMQGVFNYVKVSPQGDEISVQWQSANESGIQSYEIERSSEDVTDFRRLSRVDARGNGSTYVYVDDGAFYKTNSSKRFTYRVKAVGSSVQQYSPTVTISHDVSGVRKSWGMIKELFR